MAHTKVTKTGTQHETGTPNTFSYSGSFDVFKASEVEVELDNVALTFITGTINESASPREYTVDYTNKTVHIGGANLVSTNSVVIQPVTDMGAPTPRATYQPGSSVTSADLNNNQLQLMRKAMEYDEQKLSSRGGTMTGNLNVDDDIRINLGDSQDLQLYHSANNESYIYEKGSGNLNVLSTNIKLLTNVGGLQLETTGTSVNIPVNLDVDGTTTLDDTTVDGALDVNGSATIDNISINEDTIATTGSQIQIDDNLTVKTDLVFKKDGNHFYIDNAHDANSPQSHLYIRNNVGGVDHNGDIYIQAKAGEDGISILDDGSVALYHNGIVKFATNEIYGLVASDNFTSGDTNTYDLGKDTLRWRDIYVNNIKGDSIVTSGTSDSDSKVYSAKRSDEIFQTQAEVDARIINLVDNVGGFVPITNETSFPNANPDINNGAGTLVSVPLANNITSNGSGIINNDSSTQATTLAGTAVTITDAGNNKTFTAGFAIIVETTSTLNEYKFHRYVPNADDVTTVAGKIDEVETVADNIVKVDTFYNTYQIDDFSPSAPSTDGGGNALSAGDLAYDTNANKLKVYTGSTWQAAASLNGTGGAISGDINFNDDVKLKFGSEFELFNGTTGDYENQHVLRTVNTETLLFEVANGSAGVVFNHRVGAGPQFENMMSLVPNGSVTLRYDHSAKLATQDTGIDVTGGVYATGTFTAGSNIKANTDTGYVSAGAHDDIKILHDNTANRIQSTTDFPTYIEIPTGQKLEINHAQLEVMARFNPNTSVELFYDGGATPKLATTANGVTVTGSLVTTENVNVTGNINASSNVTISKGTNKTNSIEHLLTLAHTSSETTTTGFGTGIKFQAERNNGALQTIGDIDLEADVNLDSTISAAMVFKPSVAGVPTERMHISSAGTTTLKSGEHDGGLYVLAANNNQSTKVQIQAKTSGGTEHTWNLAVPRSADRFGIDNGVNTYLTILDGGNVGIGTLSPASTLHLDASGGAALQLQRTSSNATNRFQLSVDGTDGTIDSSNATIFRNAGETRMTVTSSGRVEIKGSRGGDLQANDDDSLKLFTKSTTDDINRGTGITFYTHDGSGHEMGGTIQVAKENGTTDDAKAYMRFSTHTGSTTTEALRIHSHGQLELKVPDANDALKITPSGTNANAKVNFNTPGTGAAVFKVQGSERLSIAAGGGITNTGSETSYITTHYASNFAKLDIRGTNIADSNHYILSYGEGHANDHGFHMVNTVGDIVFRTGNDPNLTINSSGDVAVNDGQFSVSDAVNDTDFTDDNLPGAVNGLYVANTQATDGVWSALTAMAYNDITSNQSASFIAKSVTTGYSPDVHITQRDGNTQRTAIKIPADGSVELYYDGGADAKFKTRSNGAEINGIGYVRAVNGGDGILALYADNGDDNDDNWRLLATHTGSNFQIDNYADGAWETSIKAVGGGTTELYHNNSKKLHTISTGVAIGCDDTASNQPISGNLISSSLVLDPTENSTGTAIALNNCGSGNHWGIVATSSGAAGAFALFYDTSADGVGSITFGSTGTSYNESSDYRIKENAVDITDGITRLKQLKPYKFNYKKVPDKTVDGFFAHEAQTVVPEAVTGTKDEVDASGAPIIQGIDKSKLVPLLTAALQEAIAKIEVLETKVAALEAA